jgi:N-acetylneuraminate synthase
MMHIKGREIGNGQPPYVVAEIGANHGGSLARCLETMTAAKRAGADAVKLQAYTADTITLNSWRDEFWIKEGPWKGKRLWDLYKQCETPFEWFPRIADHAEEIDITWFASVFDRSSIDMLEKLECPAYKIASFEIVDLPLIHYAASTKRPVIISTGMANRDEIYDAYWMAIDAGGKNPIKLHCVSAYPAKASDYDLTTLTRDLYGVSDHTLGLEVPIAATALGACMIEKHFCLEGVEGEDAAFSLKPVEFARMTKAVLNTWAALQPKKSEGDVLHKPYRRSLFAVEDIKQGEAFTHDNVRSIRPGNGLRPDMIEAIVGKKALRDIERGEPMTRDMFT